MNSLFRLCIVACGSLSHGLLLGRRHTIRHVQRTSFALHDVSTSPEEAAKAKAAEALEKIRSRQEEELRQTERLLQIVEQTDEAAHANTLPPAIFALGEDYGFRSRSEGAPCDLNSGGDLPQTEIYGGPPSNIVSLGIRQFIRNWEAIRGEYSDEPDTTQSDRQVVLQKKLKALTLNTTAIWELELADGPINAPLIIKLPYFVVCFLLDVVFEGKYVPSRFFLLETGTCWLFLHT